MDCPTLWLRTESEACAPCAGTAPACGAAADAPPCDAPEIVGPDAAVQRVLSALHGVASPRRGGNLVDARCIRALRIDAGEAELALTFAPHCGIHQQAAEAAFQILRRELPDTDVYVTHPA